VNFQGKSIEISVHPHEKACVWLLVCKVSVLNINLLLIPFALGVLSTSDKPFQGIWLSSSVKRYVNTTWQPKFPFLIIKITCKINPI